MIKTKIRNGDMLAYLSGYTGAGSTHILSTMYAMMKQARDFDLEAK